MKKTLIVTTITLLTFLISGCNYQQNQTNNDDKYPYSDTTYDDCIEQGNSENDCEKYISTRNKKMEEEFTKILKKIIKKYPQINISIKELKALNLINKSHQIMIILNCEKISYDEDKAIIGNIAEKIFAEYPNEFGEKTQKKSWVYITGCSQIGTSPDGINTYYHPTQWRIKKGHYGSET